MNECQECGMPCEPGEYHPFAACLMFKACHDSRVVRANITAVVEQARAEEREACARVADEQHAVYDTTPAEDETEKRLLAGMASASRVLALAVRARGSEAVKRQISETDEFAFGYLVACQNLLAAHDRPSEVVELLRTSGVNQKTLLRLQRRTGFLDEEMRELILQATVRARGSR